MFPLAALIVVPFVAFGIVCWLVARLFPPVL